MKDSTSKGWMRLRKGWLRGRLSRILLVTSAVVCSLSCSNADHLYCNYPARFVMENTFQVLPLHTACNSLGEFCIITSSNGRLLFNGKSYPQITSFTSYYLGLSGLIVGLPNQTEMLEDSFRVVCFDLACPNCYKDFGITKPLALQDTDKFHCKSCQRDYNPNDMGRISSDHPGRPLFRYRVSYVGSTLVVNNIWA